MSIDPFNRSVKQLKNCINIAKSNDSPRALATDEKTIYNDIANRIASK